MIRPMVVRVSGVIGRGVSLVQGGRQRRHDRVPIRVPVHRVRRWRRGRAEPDRRRRRLVVLTVAVVMVAATGTLVLEVRVAITRRRGRHPAGRHDVHRGCRQRRRYPAVRAVHRAQRTRPVLGRSSLPCGGGGSDGRGGGGGAPRLIVDVLVELHGGGARSTDGDDDDCYYGRRPSLLLLLLPPPPIRSTLATGPPPPSACDGTRARRAQTHRPKVLFFPPVRATLLQCVPRHQPFPRHSTDGLLTTTTTTASAAAAVDFTPSGLHSDAAAAIRPDATTAESFDERRRESRLSRETNV